jgi:hypothetical protein
MAREVDRAIARFDEVMNRLPGADRHAISARSRRISRSVSNAGRRLRRGLYAVAVILVASIVAGLVLGGLGAVYLLVALLLPVAFVLAMALPLGGADIETPALRKLPPAELPARTDVWLDARRRDLPRLAAPTLDRISAKLNSIGPQLAAVPAMDPLAQDIGRLLNTHLPELVERYQKVPPEMRRAPGEDGGPSIEARLVAGLETVDTELARASENLAAGPRDAFLIQGKFLENKYKAPQVGD